MVIQPKIRGFICTTAHPKGCEASVKRQIEYVKEKGAIDSAKKVLVIGSSTGYGLASRIAVAFGSKADTLGVMFEREATERRTATAGYYNTQAFEKIAKKEGLYAKTINGDAFSKDIKAQVIETIKKDMGKVDMVIYSLAAPRRTMEDGTVYTSVLKTLSQDFVNKNIDLTNRTISEARITPANEDEAAATVKVMGGEDWKEWIDALVEADAIENDALTFAYSYIGPKLTFPIYHAGTIGKAKEHLYETANAICEQYSEKGIKGYISVNKALVTQSSAAIPVVPLYITILYKIMKEKGLHEGCIEQLDRFFRDKINGSKVEVDEVGMVRLDDYEMRADVQEAVMKAWDKISTENIEELADIDGYWEEFRQMFGFGFDGVDYEEDISLV